MRTYQIRQWLDDSRDRWYTADAACSRIECGYPGWADAFDAREEAAREWKSAARALWRATRWVQTVPSDYLGDWPDRCDQCSSEDVPYPYTDRGYLCHECRDAMRVNRISAIDID